jgi:hypothetical protein
LCAPVGQRMRKWVGSDRQCAGQQGNADPEQGTQAARSRNCQVAPAVAQLHQ